ncbi:MAG: hypothetical protein JSV51_08805 [Candidatus Bathyarchaeota archaeon]|nr:MAG: hypothetical protein JSV51_08805 [Candidatus Bathyarchaeota archaeon]
MSRTLKILKNIVTYGIKNSKTLKTYKLLESTKNTLTLTNIEIGKMSYKDPLFPQRIREYNQALIELAKAKWWASKAMETSSKESWKKAFEYLRKSEEFSQILYRIVRTKASVEYEKTTITSEGTEIKFADGVPLIPEINPIVILEGSDHEMGYQYAQELIRIFGSWILGRKASRGFSNKQIGIMKQWKKQIEKYAPEILGLIEGWAQGATDAGVPMSYYDVLDLWTGHEPPLTAYLGEEGLPEVGAPYCSGIAAWGKATVDGKLVTGSSGDHDPAFTVTIVAYPKTGNSFIFTPFGATGDIPMGGPIYFFGHPGMNNKGVAYVHHGGGPKWIEPKEYWGYGIRRAVSVLHILRFANSAKEALEMEMSQPIGDIGPGDQATAGGFYADSSYGYAIESRVDPVIIREAGVMGETDFLYATNFAIHPKASQAPWRKDHEKNWLYDVHGGWFPRKHKPFKWNNLGAPHIVGIERAALVSYPRNQFAFNILNRALGHIDIEYLKEVYRKSGSLPNKEWKDNVASFDKGGWRDITIGNASNALVVIMKPDFGNKGKYLHCVGPAKRGMVHMSPRHGNPVFNETNAFFELTLAGSPERMADMAKQKAKGDIKQAREKLMEVQTSDTAYSPLEEYLNIAEEQFGIGASYENSANKTKGNERVYNWAGAVRAFTRSQVRARQVINALIARVQRG